MLLKEIKLKNKTMKKLSPAGFIVILIVVACIVWCFVYPEQKEQAISAGGGALILGFIFGAFNTDD